MKSKMKELPGSAEKIDSPAMIFSPTTETALIFLFGSKAKELGFVIESFNSSGIDCNAKRRTSSGWKDCRIEFELYSHDFRVHRHKRSECDLIVCWEDTTPNKEGLPEVFELRSYFVATRQIWMMAYDDRYHKELEHYVRPKWSVPRGAHKDDLLIMYCKSPRSAITYLLTMTSNVLPDEEWKWGGTTKRIAPLQKEVRFSELRVIPSLKDAHFVRARMQGRFNVTPYWPQIRKIIISKNPHLGKVLRPWPG